MGSNPDTRQIRALLVAEVVLDVVSPDDAAAQLSTMVRRFTALRKRNFPRVRALRVAVDDPGNPTNPVASTVLAYLDTEDEAARRRIEARRGTTGDEQ